MTIKESREGDVTVLSLKGDLMGEPETAKLRERVNGLLNSANLKIVVDLAGVRYISSTGLGTLIACLTSAKGKGGDMRMARVTEKVESLFVITQLVKVFKEYETVDRAVESYA
jgi:anti-sigma B factor antagonist